MSDREAAELLGFDALDRPEAPDVAPIPAEQKAVAEVGDLLGFVVPPLRGLYRPYFATQTVEIPNTPRALAIATRSVVRAMNMQHN